MVSNNNGYYSNRFISLYMFLLYDKRLKDENDGNDIYEVLFRESILDQEIYDLAVDMLIPDQLSTLGTFPIEVLAELYAVSPAIVMRKIQINNKETDKQRRLKESN